MVERFVRIMSPVFLAATLFTSAGYNRAGDWTGTYYSGREEKIFSGSLNRGEELVCPPTYRERTWVFGGVVGEKELSFIRIIYRDWQLKPDTCKITTYPQ